MQAQGFTNRAQAPPVQYLKNVSFDFSLYLRQNAGVKTIPINLPNDEVVQLEKGARRLQLKSTSRT